MLKKLLILLAALLLPAAALAEEIAVQWKAGSVKVDAAILCDGSDETRQMIKSAKSAELTCDLPEDASVRTAYVRMDSAPAKIELQFLNSSRKWETAVALENPGTECILTADAPLSGRLRLLATYSAAKPTYLTELRLFSDTALPAELHRWVHGGQADVLLTVDTLAGFDAAAITAWTQQGRSVAIASLTAPKETLLALTDALWDAGLRVMPQFGPYAESTKTAENALKGWGEKKVVATVTSWLRAYQPMLLVNGGEVTALVMDNAKANAINPDYELEDASAGGMWAVPASVTAQDDVIGAIQAMGQRDDSLVRTACLVPFESAVSSDAALIP